jgi:transcriptional regulator with PAS, ATPase and Fis domain
MIEKLIKHKRTILLTGETGTGKTSWVYKTFDADRLTHANVCEIEDSLFISQLFGHRKGSFTGATCDYDGLVTLTKSGVLFLDEIGDISHEGQKKLLMFLDSKSYYSVGCNVKKYFNGQIVLATNKNLKDMVKKGEFREDLFYRVTTFQKTLSPLRERKDKVDYIQLEIVKSMRGLCEPRDISDQVLSFLNTYSFPGNYRELKSIIEYMIFNSRRGISLSSLPSYLLDKTLHFETGLYQAAKAQFETKFLKSSLIKYDYKINKTAKEIGLSKVTLLKKMKQYKLVNYDV